MSGCEKLRVYQRAMSFLEYRDKVLGSFRSVVAACDQLCRASESIPLNIAHGAAVWTPGERMLYYNHASSSALECAACLDILVAKQRIDSRLQTQGKQILHEIVSMLISMQHVADNRLREESAEYTVCYQKITFDHEKLHAYTAALAFIAWMTKEATDPLCSSDLLAKLDKSSTSVVLNIAEGNGRNSNADKIKFFKTAAKANIQTTTLLDIAYRNTKNIDQGRALLNEAGKCLTGLIKSKEQ
jgi:four helix bundle protein